MKFKKRAPLWIVWVTRPKENGNSYVDVEIILSEEEFNARLKFSPNDIIETRIIDSLVGEDEYEIECAYKKGDIVHIYDRYRFGPYTLRGHIEDIAQDEGENISVKISLDDECLDKSDPYFKNYKTSWYYIQQIRHIY